MTLTASRHMLVCLVFSANASNDIYQNHGIYSIDECVDFDKDDVVSFLRSFRKQSGGRNVEMVSFKADLNIQLAMFFIYHKIRTIRTVDYGYITVPAIQTMKKQREIEAIKEPKTEAPAIDLKDSSKTYKYMIQ